MASWSTVISFDSLAEATLARGVLAANGIRAFIPNENWWSIRGGGVPASIGDFSGLGVELQVMPADKERTLDILKSKRPETISQPGQPDFVQPVCPRCGSTDVALSSARGMEAPDGTRIDPDAEAWRCEKCQCVWMDDDAA